MSEMPDPQPRPYDPSRDPSIVARLRAELEAKDAEIERLKGERERLRDGMKRVREIALDTAHTERSRISLIVDVYHEYLVRP